MSTTSIEWACRPGTVGRVWNPTTGCAKVSAGCRNCYAETVANRFWRVQYPFVPRVKGHPDDIGGLRPRRFTDVRCHEDRLAAPLHWRKPSTVFVNSMSDLFHEDVQKQFIVDVFGIMALAHWHTFLVLTKRPDRMLSFLVEGDHGILRQFMLLQQNGGTSTRSVFRALDVRRRDDVEWRWPLPNVWLGVSIEDQATADQRIPILLKTPAALHFVSAEPLLGPVDLEAVPVQVAPGFFGSPLRWHHRGKCHADEGVNYPTLDWLIVGGESGPHARPCDAEWIRSIVDQAQSAHVPAFVKQLGSDPRGFCYWPHHDEFPPQAIDDDGTFSRISGRPGTLCHTADDGWWPCSPRVKQYGQAQRMESRKGSDPSAWPEDLRVREWPKGGAL